MQNKMQKIIKTMGLISLIVGNLGTPLSAISWSSINKEKIQLSNSQALLNSSKKDNEKNKLYRKNLETDFKNTKKELDLIKSQLDSNNTKLSNLNSEINSTNNELKNLVNEVNKNKNEIFKLTSELKHINSRIKKTNLDIKKQREQINSTLRFLQNSHNMSTVLKYLGQAKTLNGFVQQFEITNQITKHHKQVIKKYSTQKKMLEKQKLEKDKIADNLNSKSQSLNDSKMQIDQKEAKLKQYLLDANLSKKLISEQMDNINKKTEQKHDILKNLNNVISNNTTKNNLSELKINYDKNNIDIQSKQLTEQEKKIAQAKIQKAIDERKKEKINYYVNSSGFATKKTDINKKTVSNKVDPSKYSQYATKIVTENNISTPNEKASSITNSPKVNAVKYLQNKADVVTPKPVTNISVTTKTEISKPIQQMSSSNQFTNNDWIFPKTCRNKTENYGEYHPELYGSYEGGYHLAVDYSCGYGTEIFAPTTGQIQDISYSPYAFGTSITFTTNYNGVQYKLIIGHLSNVNVSQGQIVHPGDVLGSEGSTGNSTGNHTHFELWKNGEHVNPETLWS